MRLNEISQRVKRIYIRKSRIDDSPGQLLVLVHFERILRPVNPPQFLLLLRMSHILNTVVRRLLHFVLRAMKLSLEGVRLVVNLVVGLLQFFVILLIILESFFLVFIDYRIMPSMDLKMFVLQ